MGAYGVCGTCAGGYSVKMDGTMRKHPKGAEPPCAGSDLPPAVVRHAHEVEGQVTVRPAPRDPAGIYRSTEPMLAPGAPVPSGHAVLSIIAYFPYDSAVRGPQEEAALLYEDPDHLFKVLADVPNSLVRVQMKVEG